MKTRIVVEFEVNDETGIPFVERPEHVLLECRVSPPTPERPTPQVDIQGNVQPGVSPLRPARPRTASSAINWAHIKEAGILDLRDSSGLTWPQECGR